MGEDLVDLVLAVVFKWVLGADHLSTTTHQPLIVSVLDHLLQLIWKRLIGQLFADHALQRVAHGVPQQHVLSQRECPAAILIDVQQTVASHNKVHQRLVQHHPVIAGFDAAQN